MQWAKRMPEFEHVAFLVISDLWLDEPRVLGAMRQLFERCIALAWFPKVFIFCGNFTSKAIQGSGKDGRVMKEDVHRHLERQRQPQQATAQQPQYTQPVSPALSAKQQETPQSLTPIQSAMFKTMTKSLSIPHFGLSEEIDITQLVLLRPEMKKVAAEKNVQISYMPFFIKAASLALNQFPILNSSVDKSGTNIIYKSSHNIGVAMDTKQGLIVPNIKRVNQLSIVEIAQELTRLQELGKRVFGNASQY